MNVNVTCPNGHLFATDEQHLGKTTRCPHPGCGVEFVLRAVEQRPVASPPLSYAGYGQAVAATVPPARTGLAIGAMVCGIIGALACPLVGITGLILGIVALVKASRYPAVYGGKGMAIAGVCTGALSIMVPLTAAILLASLARARELSERAVCSANMRGIGQAMKIYANDSNGVYPPDLGLLLKGGLITQRQLLCPRSGVQLPGVATDPEACYAYIKSQTEADDPQNVLLYEKEAHSNGEGGNVLFQDGHVQFIKPYSRVQELVVQTEERIKAAKKPRSR